MGCQRDRAALKAPLVPDNNDERQVVTITPTPKEVRLLGTGSRSANSLQRSIRQYGDCSPAKFTNGRWHSAAWEPKVRPTHRRRGVDSNFQFRARNKALQRRPSSRSRRGWRGSAANSAPVSFLAEQGGGRPGFNASWQFATRYDHGDPWNKGHPIGQTHLFKPKDVRTIRVRPELEALPRHPCLNVIAARLDRPLPGLQLRVEHVPDMNHFGPDLQIDADISGARGFGQRDRVVEQSFRRADLDQERRQPFEIGVDWRGQW